MAIIHTSNSLNEASWVLQKEFNKEALLAALALCFEEHERSLSVEQLIMRSYTPDVSFSKMCINQLLLDGTIRCSTVESASIASGGELRQFISVDRPSEMLPSLRKFVTDTLSNLRNLINSKQDCNRYLAILRQEMELCECIQYAKYFACRDKLDIIHASPDEANLYLLLLENGRDQVFMLLWRSIKKHSENNTSGQVNFSDLVKTAFDYYFTYKAKNATIDSYPWPKQIPVSKLATVIRCLQNNEN